MLISILHFDQNLAKMDEKLTAKVNLLVFLQCGKMDKALEKVEWLQSKNPADKTIKELKR